jgi:hypothetical protein
MSEPDDTASHPGYRDDDTTPFDVMAFVALFDDAYPPPGHDATQAGHLPHGMRGHSRRYD